MGIIRDRVDWERERGIVKGGGHEEMASKGGVRRNEGGGNLGGMECEREEYRDEKCRGESDSSAQIGEC